MRLDSPSDVEAIITESSNCSSGLQSDSIDGDLPQLRERDQAAITVELDQDQDNQDIIREFQRFLQEMNQQLELISEFGEQDSRLLRQVLGYSMLC